MSFWVCVATLFFSGIAFSFLAWRLEWLRPSLWFRFTGLMMWLALAALTSSRAKANTQADAFIVVFAMAGASLSWTPFVIYSILQAIVSMARSAVSLDKIRIPPTYSLAEAAASRKDFEEALRLYREAAIAYPNESEPCRHMAEIYLNLNRPNDAARFFREAINRETDLGRKLVITFALAETLAESKGDLPGAIGVLEKFLSDHPDVEGKNFAQERLKILRTRLSGRQAQVK